MEIRAYEQFYLADAKSHLASATDYLIASCKIPADRVGFVYSTSPTMKRFSIGEPGIVAGMSGIELGKLLWRELYASDAAPEPIQLSNGRSCEYWGGWALAHFQWYWRKTFKWIFARTTMSGLLAKYSVYHEMDISRFLEDFMAELAAVKTEPNLRRIRRAAGYSQSELANKSGVNIRNIQLYEQRSQDINRASAFSLSALAGVLGCSIEDLME